MIYNPHNLSVGQNDPLGQSYGMEPFVWGAGGSRLSPDQLALRQKLALQNSQADYSPIQSPWQGLARVAQNVEGALDLKGLDKQASGQQSANDQIIAALSGDTPSPGLVATALASPDNNVQSLGKAVWDRAHPKPVNNDTVADYNFIATNLGQDAARQYLTNKADPIVNIPQPGGGVYLGPRSQMAGATQATTGDPVTKTINGKTYYQVNGDWYDNPEGR